jgi:O-antigen/teichoic acid export membrane protein
VSVQAWGALVFGVVVGWIVYRTLRRQTEAVAVSNIATVVGAVGGAAVTTLFSQGNIFGWYCIGLGIGFFAYLVIAVAMSWKDRNNWLGRGDELGPPV